MFFKVLTLSKLTFSDDIGDHLKALASTKLKIEMANRQSNNRVHAAYTLRVGFEVPRNSQVGCVAQPRTRSVRLCRLRLATFAESGVSGWFS